MKKIAIITDTDSSLPPDIAAQYGIRQVPITIHFDSETFTTGEDIDDRLLFEKIDRYNKLPTTSAPSPSAFACAFDSAFGAGADAIVCICVSSKISATYNSALNARELFAGREITVIDSLNLSMGQGFMALAAAECVQQGATVDEVVRLTAEVGNRMHTYAVLSTLKYLALSGRVGKLAAGMADTFDIKPILTVREGKLDMLEKVRSRKKAIERMLDLLCTDVDGKTIERAAIIHVNNLEGAHHLQQQLCTLLPCPASILMAEFTPGLSVHGGSGVVGVVVMA
jgi:DegV family protein with EDD domain